MREILIDEILVEV